MSELWRPIDAWSGFYEVSDAGRVRSVARVVLMSNGQRRRIPGRLLRLVTPTKGSRGGSLPRCTLSRPGRRQTYYPKANGRRNHP